MDIMLDLETFGKKPGCVVRSIGAVLFDPKTGEMGASLYFNLLREPQEKNGLVVDPDTAARWDKQSQAARDALLADPVHVSQAHKALRELKPAGAGVWAQGAAFDGPIWEAVTEAFGLPPAWRYYDLRDTRTVYALAGLDTNKVPRAGTFHNALDDCRHQVRCVAKAWQMIEARALI